MATSVRVVLSGNLQSSFFGNSCSSRVSPPVFFQAAWKTQSSKKNYHHGFVSHRSDRFSSFNFQTGSPHAVAGELARAEPVSTPEVEKLLDTIKWDSKGLVVAIAQHIDTGAILMQGFASRDAVSATLASRRATFFSRSRSSLWTKGESSGNFIDVVDVYLDCDRDSIIYLGSPNGPTCHTGAETCYYTSAADFENSNAQALSTLYLLESIIAQRKAEVAAKPSWTKKLVENPELLCSKIREEANELCQTVEKDEGRERTVSEMADLLYHSMVLLAVQDMKLEEVLEVLRGRFSKSGIEEKKSRVPKS